MVLPSGAQPAMNDGHASAAEGLSHTWRHSGAGVFLKEADGVPDRLNGLSGIVRDLTAEFFLERHDEFDGVETVRAKVVNEAGILGHLVGFDAKMLHHDFLHAL